MSIEDAAAINDLFEKVDERQVVLGLYEALLELPRLPGVSIEPESHGYMSSLRVKRGEDWCFSLVPTQKWLLGYVRKPEIVSGRLSLRLVQELLPDAGEKRKDSEITVRLRTFDEVLQFIALIRRG